MFLSKSLILILGIAIYLLLGTSTFAHRSDEPEGVHRVIEALYDLRSGGANSDTEHNYNNFENRPSQHCGYIGGHSGYDVNHEKDKAKFYSLTTGVVVHVKMPENPSVDLSYITVYNEDDNVTILYLHLSCVEVEVDDEVSVGQYLGKQGLNSDFSTDYHIHLEVRDVDDEHFIPRKPSCGASQDFNNANIEPIEYLYEKLLEHEDEVGDAPSAKLPVLTQTWAGLKSED